MLFKSRALQTNRYTPIQTGASDINAAFAGGNNRSDDVRSVVMRRKLASTSTAAMLCRLLQQSSI